MEAVVSANDRMLFCIRKLLSSVEYNSAHMYILQTYLISSCGRSIACIRVTNFFQVTLEKDTLLVISQAEND